MSDIKFIITEFLGFLPLVVLGGLAGMAALAAF